jgi:predicted ribosomally synthesized peptide with nif11-like leader
MSAEGLEALRARVGDDPSLARRLRAAEPERFTDALLRAAAEAGCDVTAGDLGAAIARARREWILRWTL